MSTRTRVGIVGLDFWYHAWQVSAALAGSAEFEVVGAVSDDEDLAERYTETFGLPVFASLDEFSARNVEIVIICTKTAQSVDASIASLDRGMHILASRPVSVTVEDAERLLVRAGQSPELVAGVQYYSRYWPGVQTLLDVVASGAIGTPQWGRFNAHRVGPAEDRPGGDPGWWTQPEVSGGGGFTSHTIYCLNVANHVFGPLGDPEVTGSGMIQRPEDGCELGGAAIVRYGDAVVQLDGRWMAPKGQSTWYFHIIGSEGEVKFEHPEEYVSLIRPDGSVERIWVGVPDRTEAWREMFRDVVRASTGQESNVVPVAEGVADVRVNQAIYAHALSQ